MAINKVVYGSETLIDLTEDTATADTVAEGYTLHLANGTRTAGTAKYAAAPVAAGNAVKSNGILYGAVDSTSKATVFTATVDGLTELYDGVAIMLHNGVVTSASGFTININGLGALPVYSNMAAGNAVTPTGLTRETTIFNINYTMLFVYSSTIVSGGGWICYRGYYSDSNYVPTGYCTTAAGTAAKSATCTYGYRDDDNYFPCVFRYANTAANATLAISSYATAAAPIYVNGARTSSSNTFGRGVILFLYHNGAYYCYNDGRFPIVVDGAVTSVQEYVATKYTKPSGGIPKTDLASAVQTSLGKADTALQTHQSLKTINGNSLVGSGNISITGLPAVTSGDNGKVLMVVDGAWAAAGGGGGASDSIMVTLHMSSEHSGNNMVYSIPANEISALYNNTPALLYITGAGYTDPFCGCYRNNKKWSKFGYDPSSSSETVSLRSDSSSASGIKVTLRSTVLTYNSSKARYEYTVGAEPD